MVLGDIKILDLTQLLPGPFCSKLLSGFGAKVIKIERPGIGDLARSFSPKRGSDAASFHYLNTNKKSVTLELKSNEARKIFLDLVRDCDVVLESSRPGTMEKMGVGYNQIRKVNPKIIYCSISAYGQTGLYREKAAHDLNIIGLSGILEMTGEYSRPPAIPGVQIADISSGLYACIDILLALIKRKRRELVRRLIFLCWIVRYHFFLSMRPTSSLQESFLKGGKAFLQEGLPVTKSIRPKMIDI